MKYSCGQNVSEIRNKCFLKLKTPYAENVAIAFDRCEIPFFATFENDEISLVYDSDFAEFAEEIIAKSKSDDYEKITQKNYDSMPEIADIMGIVVGRIKNFPTEIQENLKRIYIELWFCDSRTIKKNLKNFITKEW